MPDNEESFEKEDSVSSISESDEKKQPILTKNNSNLIKKEKVKEEPIETLFNNNSLKRAWIGPLTVDERMVKVMKYLQKKRSKNQMKKFCYKCRKQVAEKRLRIKGRFVTKK